MGILLGFHSNSLAQVHNWLENSPLVIRRQQRQFFSSILPSNYRFWPMFSFLCWVFRLRRYEYDVLVPRLGNNLWYEIFRRTTMIEIGCQDWVQALLVDDDGVTVGSLLVWTFVSPFNVSTGAFGGFTQWGLCGLRTHRLFFFFQ